VIGNDVNSAAEATKLAIAMITQPRVGAVVGSVASICSIPISDVCQQHQVPMITPTASSPGVTTRDGTRKDYAFRAVNLEPYQSAAMAKFARQRLQAKTAAVLFDQGNDYSVGLKDAFEDAFTKDGGQILDAMAYTVNDTDFSAILTKIAYEKPDVLYLPDYFQKVGVIARQARLLGIKAVFLGGDGWDSPDIDTAAMDGPVGL
jgi:branched-chain amino acid transport system substrate-binding protein